MTSFARLVAGDLAALRGRGLWWAAAVAAVGSFAGGLAMAALVLSVGGAGAVESSTVIVSRGSTATLAVAVLASLGIAGQYRDGSWLHASLAAPWPVRRALASIVPAIALGAGLGIIAVAASAAGAALVEPRALAALPLAASAHLAAVIAWSCWMACLAHASRSPLATLAAGGGLPLVAEPAASGLLAQTGLAEARWLLPATALRSLAELPVGAGAVLDGPTAARAPLLVVVALGWTALAVLAAWLRLRGASPR